jgi:Zn-dependent M28 family amino/carboxypeptidase
MLCCLDSRHSALMLSAHYDTAPGAIGASDDAVNVATLLELLRTLSIGEPLPHALIFVFTGAEESVLPGSHGFITQHGWGSTIRAFINLEGAGGGGRELVFQSGPSNDWLIQTYARVAPYPFANIVGQEVFQTGIIPSDTDYRIYRDFGGIPGIDSMYSSLAASYRPSMLTFDILLHIFAL